MQEQIRQLCQKQALVICQVQISHLTNFLQVADGTPTQSQISATISIMRC